MAHEGSNWRGRKTCLSGPMDKIDQRALRHLATAIIAACAVSACGDSSKTIRFSDEENGKIMPAPSLASREKCYGIALAQHNDCAAGKGTDCAGTADKDYLPDHWKYVDTGSCEGLGGKLVPVEIPYVSQK